MAVIATNDDAEHRRQPDIRWEHGADQDVDRHPWEVKERPGSCAGQKAPDLIKVTQRQQTSAEPTPFSELREITSKTRSDRASSMAMPMRVRDPRAYGFQHALEGVECER